MNTIVQWATIASPIIAVLIAFWMSRRSAKDTAKQIESIKNLAKLQIEALSTELEMEMIKNKIIVKQSEEEKKEMQQILSIHLLDFRELALQEYDAKKSERNYKYLSEYLRELNRLSEKLTQVKQQLNC